MKGISSMRKVVAFLGILVLSSLYAGPRYSAGAEPSLKIGYVDLQKAARESKAGKEAFALLKKDFDQKQAIIEKRQNEIQKLQGELNQQGLLLTEESKKDKEEVYVKKLKDLKRYIDDSNQELQKKEKELTQKIFLELVKIIDKIGKEGQYTLIFERQEGLLYASQAIDVTDEVMKRYDQQGNQSAQSAAPAPASSPPASPPKK